MDVRADIVAQAQIESTELRRDSSIEDMCLQSRSLEDDIGKTEVLQISPRFVIAPKDVYILSNETGVIEARILSVPKPIVRWYRNGQLITSAQFPKIKKHHHIPETYQLEIPSASESDAGKYTCIARNCYGTITATATLRIIDLETEQYPKFVKRLTRTEILEKSNGHLTVTVSGVPKPKVEWFKNSVPLKLNKRIEHCHKEPSTYVLRFKDALPEDSGVYTCEAHNESGSTTTSAMVYVDKIENLKKVWTEDVAHRQLQSRQCPDGWTQREMESHMYRIMLANYHMKYRTPFLGYTNLF